MTDLDLCCSLLTAERNAATLSKREDGGDVEGKEGVHKSVRVKAADSCEHCGWQSRQTDNNIRIETFLQKDWQHTPLGQSDGLLLTLFSSSILLMSSGLLEEFSK